MNAETELELSRRREEARRNQERLAQWWERWCAIKPLTWALGRTAPAIDHPFRRIA